MLNKTFLPLALSMLLLTSVGWAEGKFGTAEEAKAMLEKAAAVLKQDKEKALTMFKQGSDGFKDRDLSPFCGGPDGKFTAHPTLVGESLMNLADKDGKNIGAPMYVGAQEGKISEIEYMWPRPGEVKPVKKIAFFTKIGDQICAVGYYPE